MRLIKNFLVILLVSLAAAASAQDISNIDFQQINVDELGDQQIQQIYEEANARGLTIDQITQVATSRGMSQAQASKLQQRLQRVQSGDMDTEGEQITSSRMRSWNPDTSEVNYYDQFFSDDSTQEDQEFARYQAQRDSINRARQKLRNRLFGFELFSDRTVSFEPAMNIPTPSNYQLGPGDELIIDIWGAAQSTYRLQVSPDGMVLIPNIGPINVSGQTIETASERLKERLGEIYSGLNPSDPSQKDTYVQVTLGQVRSINVTVLGEASTPGTYTLPSLATVFNALYSAGGPTTRGSFRKIEIIRGDSVVANFDLYDILISGDQSGNIRLQDQDIIQIATYQNRVDIEGEIKREGIYELKDKETMADLLTYSGGFTGNAYSDRIKIIGSNNREKVISDVNRENFDEYEIKNGDHVTVGKILNRFSNKVTIQGAVFRPGEYELNDTTSLHSLIKRADGLKGDAFTNRGIIYRTNDNYTIEAISFNVRELIENPEQHDINLVKDDVVRIASIFDLRENFTVGISGPLQKPGQYEFVYGMTLEDLIFQADGFRQSADPYRIEVARRVRDLEGNEDPSQIADIFNFSVDENLELSDEDADFELQPFDQVYVRALPNYEKQNEVAIVGEVRYPGTYSISSTNERLSDLIERSGGLTSEAYLQGATLFRDREFTEQEAQQSLANVEGLTQQEQQEMLEQQRGEQGEAQVGIELPNVLESPGSKYDLLLEKGDSLFIPKQLQTVTVKGGVFYPTTIRYEDGQSFEDYITSAGGFTDLAKTKKAYIIYANGNVDRVKSFLFFKDFPSVEPGATIVIPEDPEPINLTPQERIGLYSTITSTAVLIVTTIVQITR